MALWVKWKKFIEYGKNWGVCFGIRVWCVVVVFWELVSACSKKYKNHAFGPSWKKLWLTVQTRFVKNFPSKVPSSRSTHSPNCNFLDFSAVFFSSEGLRSPPPWLAWTQRVGRVQLKKLHVHGNMCKHIHTWNHRCALKTCFSHIYTLYLDSPFLVHWVDTVEWMCTMEGTPSKKPVTDIDEGNKRSVSWRSFIHCWLEKCLLRSWCKKGFSQTSLLFFKKKLTTSWAPQRKPPEPHSPSFWPFFSKKFKTWTRPRPAGDGVPPLPS